MRTSLPLIGYASGVAANNPDCALGPWYLYYHPERLNTMPVHWTTMIKNSSATRGQDVLALVEHGINELSHAVLAYAKNTQPFCVIGGDHSCAMGTWSAVAHANRPRGDIGLIWIDAHMDSHTPDTSTSQNIHGMPVAHLLGEGVPSLCQLLDEYPKIKPENLCIIGVRSYEAKEAERLKRLGVSVYFMNEVTQRGIQTIIHEACQRVSRTTCGFGISIDMDAIDPQDAPGVGCPEPGGIPGAALVLALQSIQHEYKNSLLGLELAEFNPINDNQNVKTTALLVELMQAVFFSSPL